METLTQYGRMMMLEVWFDLQDGRKPCLPRYTYPEMDQALLLHHLKWELPGQPPPKIYGKDIAR